jgi:hypothetical protein
MGQPLGVSSFHYASGVFVGPYATNTEIIGNKIHDYYYNGVGGWGMYGICYNAEATSLTKIYNNEIYKIKADGDPNSIDYSAQGIYVKTGGNIEIYFNSIYLSGNTLSATYTTSRSMGIGIGTGCTALNIRNNSVQNSMTTAAGTGTNKTYAIYSLSGSSAFTAIDFNNYYVTGLNPNVGFLTSDRVDLAAWQAAVPGQELNSQEFDPDYTSTSYLMPLTGSILMGNATPLTSDVPKDILLVDRSLTAPTIGAYELAPPTRTLNLTYLFLEGLYNGPGSMNQTKVEDGVTPKWPGLVADTISVELHDITTYATVVYQAWGIELSTTGTATVTIPAIYGDFYYLTIKTRNSNETTSASPVDFSTDIINYAFDSQATAYGLIPGYFPLADMGDGYALYAGDVNQDGIVDLGDLLVISNLNDQFAPGYLVEDVNGDGLVDLGDLLITSNNNDGFVATKTP